MPSSRFSRQRYLILPRLLIQLVELLILLSSRSPIHRSFIAHPPSVINSIHSHAPLLFLLLLFTSRALKLIYLLLGQQPRRSRGFRRKFPLFTSREARYEKHRPFSRRRPMWRDSQRDSLLTRRFRRKKETRVVSAPRARRCYAAERQDVTVSHKDKRPRVAHNGVGAPPERPPHTLCHRIGVCAHTRDTN